MSRASLLQELEAELCTGMPGPPPPRRESARLKQARLLRLAQEMRRVPRAGAAA